MSTRHERTLRHIRDEADHILGKEDMKVAHLNAKAIQHMVDSALGQPQNVRDAAEALGLRTYDTALPQPWVDRVRDTVSYLWTDDLRGPVGHVVWSYDSAVPGKSNIGGYPVAITPEGRAILGALALHATKGR